MHSLDLTEKHHSPRTPVPVFRVECRQADPEVGLVCQLVLGGCLGKKA